MSISILVGVDGRDESGDAVTFAIGLAEALDGKVAVAAVLEYNALPIDINPYEVALREHFDRILAGAREVAGEFPLEEHRLTGTSPGKELGELGSKLGADLLVLGSTHRGRVGRVLPGSTASSLLSGGDRPVAVVPRRAAGGPKLKLDSIGVGFDGTPESELALEVAAGWAETLGARLRLIGVVPNPGPFIAEVVNPSLYEDALRGRLSGQLAKAAEGLSGLEVETVLESGDPRQILLDQAEDLGVLVLGSRGYGPLGRVLLGSISRAVLHDGPCPLVVVPRGAAEAAATS